MYLSHLSLNDFRNYQSMELSLSRGLFIFCGDNAQGKTNLLEAVGILATATSFHASSDREVVNWQAAEHIARLSGRVQRHEDNIQIEITIFDPNPQYPGSVSRGVEIPANTPRKRLKLNGVPRKTVDLIGQMKVVLFAPTDLHLIDGSPEERRRFLDRALCQVHPRYCQALVKYRKIVTQRAALLKRIRDHHEDPRMLDYLDEQLTLLSTMIVYERQRMVSTINQWANDLQEAISGQREHLQIVYRPSFTLDPDWNPQETQQHFHEQLRSLQKREIQQGVCLLGPHRDDLEFLVNGINMLTYGSRGQQRTAALAAKFAELSYMRATTGDEPVLLLDDVFSELDAKRREYLLQQIIQHEQVLLTATDLTGFPQEILQQAHIYGINAGNVQAA